MDKIPCGENTIECLLKTFSCWRLTYFVVWSEMMFTLKCCFPVLAVLFIVHCVFGKFYVLRF